MHMEHSPLTSEKSSLPYIDSPVHAHGESMYKSPQLTHLHRHILMGHLGVAMFYLSYSLIFHSAPRFDPYNLEAHLETP